MKYKYILIDMQNCFWRAFIVAVKNVICDEETSLAPLVIKKALAMLRNLHDQFGYVDSKIYLLFDNPESVLNMRKAIDEDYKSARFKKEVPKGIYEVLSVFIEILKNYSDNYAICKVPSLEADDLTYSILKSLPIDSKDTALVISNDMDWARNIDENIYWYNYDKVYSFTNFQKEYKFSPKGKSVQIYKAIHGDKSDNIENAVPHLPQEILLDIVNRFESVDDLFKNLWKAETEYPHQWKLKLKEAENNIRKNFTLVDFILLDISASEFILYSRRRPKLLRAFFKSFDLPLEKDMFIEEDRKQPFPPRKVRKSL